MMPAGVAAVMLGLDSCSDRMSESDSSLRQIEEAMIYRQFYFFDHNCH